MKTFTNAAASADHILHAQTRAFKTLINPVFLVLLLTFGMTLPLSLHATPEFCQASHLVLPTGHQATAPLNTPVSAKSSLQVQLLIISYPGLEGTTAQLSLSSDRQSIQLLVTPPAGASLPSDEMIAQIQVYDPDTQTQQNFVAVTESGGIMVILADL